MATYATVHAFPRLLCYHYCYCYDYCTESQYKYIIYNSQRNDSLVVGAERKLAAHAVACRAAGTAFVPLVVESLGGWSNEAADTITKIGRLQGQRLGVPPAESIRHLFQRCAIALWRGNASMWIRRLPAHPPVVDGIL